jgi:hypothetical protein
MFVPNIYSAKTYPSLKSKTQNKTYNILKKPSVKEKTQGKIQKLKGNPGFNRPLKNRQADMLLGKKVHYQALTSIASYST